MILTEATYNYNCLMVNCETPGWSRFINNYISPNDIYTSKQGLELTQHITVLYGLHSTVTIQQLKPFLSNFKLNNIKITSNNINIFENDEFDVVYFECISEKLNDLNFIVQNNFPFSNQYTDYAPHMTIAYVKKGTGIKYKKQLNKTYVIYPSNYFYSKTDDTTNYITDIDL